MKYRLNADQLADLLNGRWDIRPPDEWELNRLLSAQRLGRRRRAQPGTLCYPGQSGKALKRVGRVKDASVHVAVISDGKADEPIGNLPALRVDDLTSALDALNKYVLDAYEGKVIAVTGSVGKSTTCSMISGVLARVGEVSNARGNYLADLRPRALALDDEDFAVFEVSRASLPGAEAFLAPNVVLITSIAEAHMDATGSLEQTAKVKSILLEGLVPSGTAVINADTPHAELLLEKARASTDNIVRYGTSPSSEIRLLAYDYEEGTVTARIWGDTVQYVLGIPGHHNAVNSLGALGVLHALGLDPREHLEGFERLEPVVGRGTTHEVLVRGRQVTLVDESFNANPTSMKASLESFRRKFARGRRVLVLGDMLELGPSAEAFHQELVELIVAVEPAQVFLVGSLMHDVWRALPPTVRGEHAAKALTIAEAIPDHLEAGDAVLVKASHGVGLGALIEAWTQEDE